MEERLEAFLRVVAETDCPNFQMDEDIDSRAAFHDRTLEKKETEGSDKEIELFGVIHEHASEQLKKQYSLRLFEQFRSRYDSLSKTLRRSLENESKILENCQELKTAVLCNAAKLQITLQVKQEDEKAIEYYRESCEAAWKEAHLAKQREAEAMQLIADLREEVDRIKKQTNEARILNRQSAVVNPLTVPMTAADIEDDQSVASLSYDEWKKRNNIWTPEKQPLHQKTNSSNSLASISPSTKKKQNKSTPVPTLASSASSPGLREHLRTPMQQVSVNSIQRRRRPTSRDAESSWALHHQLPRVDR